MKKISTLLLSSLFSIAALAMYDDPYLSISSFGTGKDLQVEVDGRRYSFDKDNSIIIKNLRTGSHTIKITKERKRGNSNRIFDIWNNNNKREVVYNGRINLRRGYDFDITINKFGKVFTDEASIDNNDWNNGRDNDRDRDNNDPGRDRDRDRDYDRDNDRNNDRDRDGNYGNGYGREMSNSDFNRAKETLRREVFENTRLDLAKQVINSNLFTTQQVKELVQLFVFEDNKLDLAKYAYRYTLDKNNYYLINDVFTFSNSRDQLARFIREYRE
jgi:Domain of unknown function (DUF4476)